MRSVLGLLHQIQPETNTDLHILVSCGQDTFVKLWNVEEDYQNFATLRGHENRVLSCRFLPDDLHILSAGADHSLRIWEVSTTFVPVRQFRIVMLIGTIDTVLKYSVHTIVRSVVRYRVLMDDSS